MSRSRGERSLPQAVAQDDDRVLAGRDFVRREQRAAQLGAHTQVLEVVAGHELAEDRLGAEAGPQVDGHVPRPDEPGERPIVVAEVLVVGVRQRHLAASARLVEHDGQVRRPLDAGEGVESQALEQRERRSVQADADREHGGDGE